MKKIFETIKSLKTNMLKSKRLSKMGGLFSIQPFMLLVLGFFAFTQPTIAQKAAEELTKEDAIYQPVTNSLLWAITGQDLADTSYLFGTIHLIGREDFFLTEETKKAFDASEQIVFEINLDNMNDLTSQFGLLMNAFMNEGKTLQDLLPEDEYESVKDFFAKKGITDFLWNMMERIKPMFLTMFASTDLTGESSMLSEDMMSYEMELMSRAKSAEKPINGLETAEYQMSMFDSIPYDAQAKILVQSIQSDTTASDELKEMVELYKSQDINSMVNLFSEDKEGVGKYEQFLLINRNKNWIPVMSEMAREGTTFFGVGAGHLAGKHGLIYLLRKEGYTLTPIKDKTVLKKL